MILTDRDQRTGNGGAGGTSDLPWGSAADGTCETRTYLLQNWRADTSVLMKATSGGGVVLQRIKYSPYGKPEYLSGIQDFNKDGYIDFSDFDDFVTAFGLGEPAADVNQDGLLDFSDFDAFQGAFEDTSITDGGREIRKLWAGYEAETTTGARELYHVRFRAYSSNFGRWTTRDPYGYIGGLNLYEYVMSSSIMLSDPFGLAPNDQLFGLPDAFGTWYHKTVKQSGDPDLNKSEAEAYYKEWENAGKPDVKKGGKAKWNRRPNGFITPGTALGIVVGMAIFLNDVSDVLSSNACRRFFKEAKAVAEGHGNRLQRDKDAEECYADILEQVGDKAGMWFLIYLEAMRAIEQNPCPPKGAGVPEKGTPSDGTEENHEKAPSESK